MKAMSFGAFGGVDSLRSVDLPKPEPGPGEVLVEVATLSVNPVDWKLRSGVLRWLSPLRYSPIPCFDYAGRAIACGPGVESPRPGDRVFGMCPLGQAGAAREYLVARPGELAATPEHVNDEQAAGVALAGMTALQALRTPEPLRPGAKLLVVGASGGVGHYAVQIGKALGLMVTAVCSTPNVGWVRALGADEVMDYRGSALDAPVAEYDRVLDAVSLGTFARWRRWLKPGGGYVTLLPSMELVRHRLSGPRAARHSAHSIFLKPCPDDLRTLAAWLADGRLRTVIDSVFPFEALLSALQKSQAGHACGKILVCHAS